MISAKAQIQIFGIQAKLHWEAKPIPELCSPGRNDVLKTLSAIQRNMPPSKVSIFVHFYIIYSRKQCCVVEKRFGSTQIPVLLFISCEILEKSQQLSDPQPHPL